MRKIIIKQLGFAIIMALTAGAAQAESIVIPEKVRANILKRYPTAQDLQGSHEVHYKRKLLEVVFKVEGEPAPLQELFREDGHLFSNELPVDDISEASTAVKKAVDEAFPGNHIKKIEMIANPNGIGEEYEIYLQAGGANWKASVNEKGEIVQKESW
jgi:hypothetical protein